MDDARQARQVPIAGAARRLLQVGVSVFCEPQQENPGGRLSAFANPTSFRWASLRSAQPTKAASCFPTSIVPGPVASASASSLLFLVGRVTMLDAPRWENVDAYLERGAGGVCADHGRRRCPRLGPRRLRPDLAAGARDVSSARSADLSVRRDLAGLRRGPAVAPHGRLG